MAMHPQTWQATTVTVGLLQVNFPRKNKKTINLYNDAMLQLPEFISGAMYCCMWGLFLFANPVWQHWAVSLS